MIPLLLLVTAFFHPAQPTVGVKVPHVGVKITVTKQNGTSMTIKVAPAAKT